MDLRKIIHVDMDAFFAAVEQRDHPELRGLPIAVGHAGGRGVVATASYEARRWGVRSAMSSVQARKLCPTLIFVPGRGSVYKAVSQQIHEIFHRYTDIIEPISLDEAFLDVTVNHPGIELAVDIARRIKAEIHAELNLVASAGVSYNKFLAKIASDFRKPDGLCTIHPSQALDFISRLPVEDFWGVGPVTARRMHALGIHTGADLRRQPLPLLTHEFGKAGAVYFNFARGIDNRPVTPERVRKSLGCEHTFESDISDTPTMERRLAEAAAELAARISRKQFAGNSLTLKVKFHDFRQITRSVTLPDSPGITDRGLILRLASKLMSEVDYATCPVRLIGLSVSNPRHDLIPDEMRQLIIDFDNPDPTAQS